MLKNFFEPKSVAVLGASATPGKVGYDVLKNLIQSGYKGKIYPINPKSPGIQGLKAYPNLSAIDANIDLLIYIIPPQFILSTLDECKKKNIDSIIAISAGFKETGSEGARIEREMLKKAKELNIRILGPNCLGLISTSSRLNATFAPGMTSEGNIAFFSQSGALCIAILDWALGEGIGFSKFISLGNKSDLNEIDFMRYLADDESTKVILGYLEGIDDGRTFMEVAKEVSKKKPVIITKSGGTSAGAKAASSHTASLAGSERSIQAAFHQSGVIRADTVSDLFNYALAFACQPIPKGSRIAILTNSGGPGIMAADAIEHYNLRLASFSKETQDKLRSFLPTIASIYNPVDIIGDAKAERYHKSLELILQDPHVDGVLVILTPTAVIDVKETAGIVGRLSSNSDKPILSSFMGKKSVAQGIKVLQHKKIPNYDYPESAVKVFKTMLDYRNWLDTPASSHKTFKTKRGKVATILAKYRKKNLLKLGEQEAREVISSYGFKVPKNILAQTGGIYVEVLKDVSFRIATLNMEDADEMIREINSFPLLRGVRGERPKDIAALRECLLRLSQLVTDFPEIIELDINPLIVREEGEGAVAADARITLEEG